MCGSNTSRPPTGVPLHDIIGPGLCDKSYVRRSIHRKNLSTYKDTALSPHYGHWSCVVRVFLAYLSPTRRVFELSLGRQSPQVFNFGELIS